MKLNYKYLRGLRLSVTDFSSFRFRIYFHEIKKDVKKKNFDISNERKLIKLWRDVYNISDGLICI